MSRIADLVAKADDLSTEIVKVPEWGCEIGVRTMDGHGRNSYIERWNATQESGDKEQVIMAEIELIIACAFDPEDDSLVFMPSDQAMLKSKSGAVIARLAAAALRVNALDVDANERLGKDSSASDQVESLTEVEDTRKEEPISS
jgi:hypothetical protein